MFECCDGHGLPPKMCELKVIIAKVAKRIVAVSGNCSWTVTSREENGFTDLTAQQSLSRTLLKDNSAHWSCILSGSCN